MPALGRSRIARALDGRPRTLVRVPLGWDGMQWPLHEPLDYLGFDGGAGLGSGPGMSSGAALALRGTGRPPIGIVGDGDGDGDLTMGLNALWSAARAGAGCCWS